MKYWIAWILLSAIWITLRVMSDAPNRLEEGKPAEAQEVNENFDVLDAKIEAIEGCRGRMMKYCTGCEVALQDEEVKDDLCPYCGEIVKTYGEDYDR